MIYLQLLWAFFKIGALTFGGGLAMLPLIEDEVLSHGWIDRELLVNFIAVAESTPGPIAVNLSTYVGSEVGGFFGALCATLGVVTPSFIIILIVARCYEKFKENKIVKGCMSGLKPCVVGLIGAAAVSVFCTVFIPDGFKLSLFSEIGTYTSLGIFAAALFMSHKKLHPIFVVCFSAIAGIAFGYLL
ncbi:MAG: chromate transporter [Ruminococcaceae bacterium]|nr:chromate transporter [Oscillospiraceae bacterium]